jgi:hypothetical protein
MVGFYVLLSAALNKPHPTEETMSPRTLFVLVMIGLLLVANVLMLAGYTNYPTAEGFTNYVLSGAAAGDKYVAIGAYDNVVKKPEHGLSDWRGPAPNEPLMGPEFEVGDDSLFLFKNNQCKPECCGASFSCGSGCVCTTPAQRELINSRGGNRTGPADV